MRKAVVLVVVLVWVYGRVGVFGQQRSARQLLDQALNDYRAKQYDEAIQKLNHIIQRNATLLEARFWRGMCYYLTEQYEQAERDFLIVSRLKPSSREARRWLERTRRRKMTEGASSQVQEALQSYRAGNYESAAFLLQEHVSSHPYDLSARFWLAASLLKAGNPMEAERHLMFILQEDHLSLNSHVWRGRVEEAKGAALPALQRYFIVKSVNPNHEEAAQEYRRLYRTLDDSYKAGFQALKKGRAEEAVGHLEPVAQQAEDWAEFQFLYGRALLRSGQTVRAEEAFQKVLQVRPMSFDALYWLARVQEERGDVDEAAHRYAFLLRVRPQHRQGWQAFESLTAKHSRAVRLMRVEQGKREKLKPLVRLVNLTGAALTVMVGGQEHFLSPDERRDIEVEPSRHEYFASVDGGLSARGVLFFWTHGRFELTFTADRSRYALLNPFTQETMRPHRDWMTTLRIINRTSSPALLCIGVRRFQVPPRRIIKVPFLPGTVKYDLTMDGRQNAQGEMTLPPHRAVTWVIDSGRFVSAAAAPVVPLPPVMLPAR